MRRSLRFIGTSGIVWFLLVLSFNPSLPSLPPAQGQGLSLSSACGASGTAWQWYKTDTHIHSVVSADAFPDLGVLSEKAKAAGYNALFLTDHNLASAFPINSLTANHFVFEDSYTRWTTGIYGTLSSNTNALVSSPRHTGTKSLHLGSSSTGYGESFIRADRGPNFRSGSIIIQVSIYPVRIDPSSGVYVSVSIGGDPTITAPLGYTTQDGIISQGKSTVLVWQLGSARSSSPDPNTRVLTYSLGGYTLNTWNTYTVNVTAALPDIPLVDRPVDYNGLSYLKIAAAGNAGTADAYFDTYIIDSKAPLSPGQEFVYRNSLIHTYDTSTFKIFPSVEIGISKHANRLNFGITDPSQFVSYTIGIDGILPTQQTGYSAQLNHPGSSGGVSSQEAINTKGEGADLIEVRNQAWIDIWDKILNQGVQILGTGSTDKHTASYSSSSDATVIHAPTLEFDPMVCSLFEGRAFDASSFSGTVIFNIDSGSSLPYPARYPVYVSDSATQASVHLKVPSGVSNGYSVKWIRNAAVLSTDSITGSSFETTKSISLSKPFTYVRAEVRSSSGSLRALTQPIFFFPVTGVPADKSYNVFSVTTPDGKGYTKIMTKGITSSSWDPVGQTLSLPLENPAGSRVRMVVHSDTSPQTVRVDGTLISSAGSLSAFEGATGSSWYYDGVAKVLYLQALQASGPTSVSVSFSGGGPVDTEPPSRPVGLAATVLNSNQVNLQWNASTDNIGVGGYEIFRNGTRIATLGAVTSYSDTTVSPATTYTYTVVAFDTSGNHSLPSDPATAKTPAPSFLTFNPSDDTYIRSDQASSNFGTATTIQVDNSPVKHILLRFSVSGVSGRTVASAKLKLYTTDPSSGSGGEFHKMTNTTWTEKTITWNNAPSYDTAIVASLGPVTSGTWYEVTLTSMIPGDGVYSIRITSPSSDGADYSSKEGTAGFAPIITITIG